MRDRTVLLVGILLLLCRAPGRGETTWLTYRLSENIGAEVGEVSEFGLRLSDTKPPAMQTVRTPTLTAEKPWYGQAMAGRFAILDKSAADAKDYDVLWLDIDGSGSFEPTERLTLAPTPGSKKRGAVVALTFRSDDGPVLQHFRVSAEVTESAAYLRSRAIGYYVGEVKFGDKSYLIGIVDANGNGRFDDPSDEIATGDRVLIDYNRDGRFEVVAGPGAYATEIAHLGRYLLVDDAYWKVSVAPDGATVAVAPADVPTGAIAVEEPSVRLTVVGENGRFALDRTTADKRLRLPAGSYQLIEALVRRRHEGEEWRLRSADGLPLEFTVEDGGERILALGPPLTASLEAQKRGASYQVKLHLKGEAGFSYGITRALGRGLPAARLLVKAKEGDWRQYYRFRRRGADNYWAYVRGGTLKGKYEAVAEIEAGPFEIKAAPVEMTFP